MHTYYFKLMLLNDLYIQSERSHKIFRRFFTLFSAPRRLSHIRGGVARMERLEIHTTANAEFHEITAQVKTAVARSKIKSGVATVYVPHTTAGITINENADPDVKADMLKALDQLVPWNQPHFQHAEGNSAAHIKASMMGFSAT